MTRLFCTILILLPVFLSGQLFTDFETEASSVHHGELVHIEKTPEGKKVYSVYIEYAEKKGAKSKVVAENRYPVEVIYIDTYLSDETVPESRERYLLENPQFPQNTDDFVVKLYGKTIGTGDDVISKRDLVKRYPVFNEIPQFTRKPRTVYDSKLKTNAWKKSILGFVSNKYTTDQSEIANSEVKSKKGGLLGSLIQTNVNSNSDFEVVEKVNLNWKDTYNSNEAEGVEWKNMGKSNCPATGKVLALNGKKVKDVRSNEDMEWQVVSYDNKGDELKKVDIKTEVPWVVVKDANRYSVSELGIRKLESYCVLSNQRVSKKVNPSGNKNELRILCLDNEGTVDYDSRIELPEQFIRMDTFFAGPNNEMIGLGLYKKNDFLLKSDQDGTKLIALNDDYNGSFELIDYVSHKGIDYMITQSITGAKFVIYPFEGDKQLETIILEVKNKSKKGPKLEVLINDDDHLIFLTKGRRDLNKTYNNRSEVIPYFYKIEGAQATVLNEFGKDEKFLSINSLDYDEVVYNYDGSYYMITRQFVPSVHKPSQMAEKNRITKLNF